MAKIIYEGKTFLTNPGETILDAFLRQGQEIRFSCKKGSCKTCKTKVLIGDIPPVSQKDLEPHLIASHIFLPCITVPRTDMVLAAPTRQDLQKTLQEESPFELREETPMENPEPDAELWEALGNGKLLLQILTHFYTRVYTDKRLVPFFKATTIDRAIGKQYSFLQELMTGEKVHFGFYPRTAHHWMVIDEDLFNYREDILEESMKTCGLAANYRARWRKIDECYKEMLIKTHPWPKIIGDVLIPTGGFEVMEAEIDMVCDVCQEAIPAGSKLRYHKEEGQVYCEKCAVLEAHR